jgi:hypothetical protein
MNLLLKKNYACGQALSTPLVLSDAHFVHTGRDKSED